MTTVSVKSDSRPLQQLRVGERATIERLQTSHGDLLRKLLALGFVGGKEVEVIQRGLFGCPLNVRVLNSIVSLRKAEAAAILLEPTPNTAR
jgi:Fe2+ transport system protein FeoA